MMIKDQQIVCIGFPKWEGEYLKSTVQLMQELSRYNDVIYIDYNHTFLDVLRHLIRKKKIPLARIIGWKKRLQLISTNGKFGLYLLRLPCLFPINWINQNKVHDKISGINGLFSKVIIKRALKKIGFNRPIMINAFNPNLGLSLAGKFEEKLLVYYCYDEISAAPWIKKHGHRLEQKFLKIADLVITSSDTLQKDKSKYNANCWTVNNGVDFHLFGSKEVAVIPEKKSTYYEKTIGYLGSIDHRLDYSLLESVISRLPHYRFVFVGRQLDRLGVQVLANLSNVELVGPKPAHELPSYIETFDVGLIPFVKNKLTAAIYPLKINEYLARGKAVVSTDFTNLSAFEDVIRVASNSSIFKKMLEEAATEFEPALANKRIEIAKQNSWKNRANEMGTILSQAMLTKKRNIASKKRINQGPAII